MPFEQIVSILSVVGMASGVAAYAVVHGLRTALGAAKEVIDSLEKSYGIQKARTQEALDEAHKAREEVVQVRAEAIAAERLCNDRLAGLTLRFAQFEARTETKDG